MCTCLPQLLYSLCLNGYYLLLYYIIDVVVILITGNNAILVQHLISHIRGCKAKYLEIKMLFTRNISTLKLGILNFYGEVIEGRT